MSQEIKRDRKLDPDLEFDISDEIINVVRSLYEVGKIKEGIEYALIRIIQNEIKRDPIQSVELDPILKIPKGYKIRDCSADKRLVTMIKYCGCITCRHIFEYSGWSKYKNKYADRYYNYDERFELLNGNEKNIHQNFDPQEYTRRTPTFGYHTHNNYFGESVGHTIHSNSTHNCHKSKSCSLRTLL